MSNLSLINHYYSWTVTRKDGHCSGKYEDRISDKTITYMYRRGDINAIVSGKYQTKVRISADSVVPALDLTISERVWLIACIEESKKYAQQC